MCTKETAERTYLVLCRRSTTKKLYSSLHNFTIFTNLISKMNLNGVREREREREREKRRKGLKTKFSVETIY